MGRLLPTDVLSISVLLSLFFVGLSAPVTTYASHDCFTFSGPVAFPISAEAEQHAFPGEYEEVGLQVHSVVSSYSAFVTINGANMNLGAPVVNRDVDAAFWVFQVPYNNVPGEYAVTMSATVSGRVLCATTFFDVIASLSPAA